MRSRGTDSFPGHDITLKWLFSACSSGFRCKAGPGRLANVTGVVSCQVFETFLSEAGL